MTGADLPAPVLDVARQRAIDAGVTNAVFVEADAQIRRFEPGVAKLAISRFGTSWPLYLARYAQSSDIPRSAKTSVIVLLRIHEPARSRIVARQGASR